MSTIGKFLVFCGLLAGSARSLAQDSQQQKPGPLTLEEALAAALGENPGLQAAGHQVGSAQAQVDVAKGGHWPDLDVSLRASRSAVIAPLESGPDNNRALTARLSVPVFDGYSTTAQVESAQARLSRSEASRAVERLDLIRDVKLAFFQLLYAGKNLELARSVAERRREQEDFIRIRYKGGQEAHWTLVKAGADYQEAMAETRAAELALQSARHHLAALLARDNADQLEAAGDFVFPDQSPGPPGAVHPSHPDLVPLQMDIADAEATARTQRSRYWPTVSAFGEYSNAGRTDQTATDSWSVGLEARIPVFAADRSPGVRAALETISARQLDLAAARSQLQARQVKAHNDYLAAINMVRAAGASLAAARERATIVHEEYKAGLRQFIEWEQSQSQLIGAEHSELNARNTAARARAEWERIAMGQSE